MYPWHGNLHPPPQPPPPTHTSPTHPQTATATPSSTTTNAPYQMPSQLRWLPSMMSRSQHQPQQPHHPQQHHHHHHHQPSQTATATLPTISSNLRMAQNSNHQPVSVAVESRPSRRAVQHRHASTAAVAAAGGAGPRPEDPMDDEGSDESDHSSRDIVVLDAPGNTLDATGNGGLATATAGRQPDEVDEDGAANNTYISFQVDQPAPSGTTTAAGTDAGAGADSRKHGKRLTTKEEVTLFDICNRHAHEFGQRSNLCKWWITVTAEFTHDQGHPYSWHSVRRKVEMVTKQRVKFLEELREKNAAANDPNNTAAAGEDLSNPRWRAAVDAWIPTWQRWEEAEAKRIEKRDSRKTRKRKSRPWEFTGWDSVDVGASGASSPVESTSVSTSQHQDHSQSHSQAQAQAQGQGQGQGQVRLPPGFESMFSNLNPPQTPQTRKSSATTYLYQRTPPAPPAQTTPGPGLAPAPTPEAGSGSGSSTERNMMTALLETLGKLNKHLDSANPPDTPIPSSTFVSQSQSRSQGTPRTSDTLNNDSGDSSFRLLKEELRREMREEFRREIEQDRASLEEKLDSVQRTQEMILEMLRQEPA